MVGLRGGRVGGCLVVSMLVAGMVIAGCKKPHATGNTAPDLRGTVRDLAEIRGGDHFWLTWTVPRKGTRKLAVNGNIAVRVCRRESLTGRCTEAGIGETEQLSLLASALPRDPDHVEKT